MTTVLYYICIDNTASFIQSLSNTPALEETKLPFLECCLFRDIENEPLYPGGMAAVYKDTCTGGYVPLSDGAVGASSDGVYVMHGQTTDETVVTSEKYISRN